MSIGNLQQVQKPLDFAVFAPIAVKRVKHRVRLFFPKRFDQSRGIGQIMLDHLITALAQSRSRPPAGHQAHFPFGRKAARQHQNFL